MQTIMIRIVLLISLVLFGPCSFAQKASLEPLFSLPYVVIYGRQSCPFTLNMKKELKRAGIDYQYQVIDEMEVKKQLYPRMRASGLSTQTYTLPVLDINNHILVHPEPTEVIDKYHFN